LQAAGKEHYSLLPKTSQVHPERREVNTPFQLLRQFPLALLQLREKSVWYSRKHFLTFGVQPCLERLEPTQSQSQAIRLAVFIAPKSAGN
jgi:hypothetical protein